LSRSTHSSPIQPFGARPKVAPVPRASSHPAKALVSRGAKSRAAKSRAAKSRATLAAAIISAMLVATWNVNSIKQRLAALVSWLSARQPDIVCLQETKCVDDGFPREPLEALGYNLAIHGQKTFNGVAILSKLPFDEVTPRLPGDDADDHAR